MSFTAGSAQVVSANSFKRLGVSPEVGSSKKFEMGKVFRPGHPSAGYKRSPSLTNSRGFKVSPSLRKKAAAAVAASDSHSGPVLVGAFSFKTNYRKSLAIANRESTSTSCPTTPPTPTHTVIGDVDSVAVVNEQGLAPINDLPSGLRGTPRQLEGEWRLKKAAESSTAESKKPAGGAHSAIAHLRRNSNPDQRSSSAEDSVNANRRPSSVQQIMRGIVGAGKEILSTPLFNEGEEGRPGTARGPSTQKRSEVSKRSSVRLQDKWWLY